MPITAPSVSSVDSTTLQVPIERLYGDHHGWLLAWLRRRLSCTDRAADLAQDTFVRVLGTRPAAPIREPRAYLTTVARSVLVNWLERQSLERAYLATLASHPEPLAPSPEERLLVLEPLAEVDTLLDGLPPLIRRAFLLSRLDGLSHEEIARLLGVSLASVKRYVRQAFRHCLGLMA